MSAHKAVRSNESGRTQEVEHGRRRAGDMVSAEVTVLHGGRGNVYSENLEIMGCKQV